MKNLQKTILFLIIALAILLFIPNHVSAKTTSVYDDATIREAIEKAENGDVISLTANIQLIRPIEITEKNITINGNGFTISRNIENWSPNGENGTLLTAGKGARLNLQNLTLTKSQKYGVQSYNGGYVILDNVTITDNGFGGVLANAGTVEVKNLHLGHNGMEDSNNGIEIAKGQSLTDSETHPVLKMNGTLTSTEETNVVYVDITNPVGGFEVINTENTTNKIFLNDNKIVVTDANNNVIFASNDIGEIEAEGSDYVPNITLTVKLNDQNASISVIKGQTITKESVLSQIDLNKLNLGDYNIDGFFADPEYSLEFDFAQALTDDTTIYAKLSLKQVPETPAPQPETNKKDETPKTGIGDTLEFIIFVSIMSAIALVILKNRKNLKY